MKLSNHPIARVEIIARGLVLACLLICGCRDGGAAQGQTGLRTVQMKIGGSQFTLEVADNDARREIGLMNRDSMPADHGMIFAFADEQPRGFWMKNTRIDLDIIYVNAAGQIVSTHTMRAFDLRTTQSAGPAKFAVELNAGMVEKLGIRAGDKLEIPGNLVSLDGN